MFATLLGSLPRPPLTADATPAALVRAVLAAQEDAGLEPVTHGGWWGRVPVEEAWRRTASLTDRAVKAEVTGPWTAARLAADDRTSVTEASLRYSADSVNEIVLALAAAGCPLIEIHEPALVELNDDLDAWARFTYAHATLAAGLTGSHLSLAITGGSVHPAGIPAVIGAPYASVAVDLIAGPENWRLVRALPGARGIVCGALSPLAGSDDGPETLVWAAAYAASGDRRGPDRVGLATAGSLASLSWDAAVTKLQRLGAAARLAGLPTNELRGQLDPRAIDARSAALGRADRPRSRGSTSPGASGD